MKNDFKKFTASLQSSAVQIDADHVLAQISPQLRGDVSSFERPSDVRLILRTAACGGQGYSFPNHGHPDNEVSHVNFDGENGIMIMPAGDTPRQQLSSALGIVDTLKGQNLSHATPDFIENHIVNKAALSHRFAAQVYGPAPFTAQADRLVDVSIPGRDNQPEMIKPQRTAGYALGMRAPVKEEAFLLLYMGNTKSLFLKGGEQAASLISNMHDALSVKMKGKNTALEALDALNGLAKAIILAVDAGTGRTKPIRLETAKEIFPVQDLNWVFVDDKGTVVDQRLKIHTTPPRL